MRGVNEVLSIDDGARDSVFRAMQKGLALKESGHMSSFAKCLERTKGTIEVFNFIDQSRSEPGLPASIVEASNHVVFTNMTESRAYAHIGDSENSDFFKERAIGALNIFDACSTVEEKQKHRTTLLNEIFPVEG